MEALNALVLRTTQEAARKLSNHDSRLQNLRRAVEKTKQAARRKLTEASALKGLENTVVSMAASRDETVNVLGSVAAALKRKQEDVHSKISSFQMDISALKAQVDKLRREKESLEREVERGKEKSNKAVEEAGRIAKERDLSRSDLKAFQQAISEERAELSRLRDERSKAQQMQNGQNSIISSLRADLQKLQEELRQEQLKVLKASDERNRMAAALQRVEAETVTKDNIAKELDGLLKKKNEENLALASKVREVEMLSARNTQVQELLLARSQLSEMQKRVEGLSAELDRSKAAESQTDQQRMGLQFELDKLKSEVEGRISEERRAFEAMTKDVRTQNALMGEELVQLKTLSESLKAQLETALEKWKLSESALTAASFEKEKAVQRLEEERRRMQELVDQRVLEEKLRLEAALNQRALEREAQLVNQIADLRRREAMTASNVEESHIESQVVEESLKSREDDIRQLLQRLEIANHNVGNLEGTVRELQLEIQKGQGSDRTIAALRDQISQLEALVSERTKESDAHTRDAEDLVQELAVKSSRIDDLQRELEEHQNGQRRRFSLFGGDRDNRARTLEAQRNEIKQNARTSRREANELRGNLRRVERVLQERERSLGVATVRVSTAEGQVAALNGSISSLKNEKQALEKEYDRLQQEMAKLRDELKQREMKLSSLEKMKNENLGKISELEKQLAQFQGSSSSSQSEAEMLRSQIAQVRASLSQAEERAMAAEKQVGELRANISSHAAAIEKVKAEIEAQYSGEVAKLRATSQGLESLKTSAEARAGELETRLRAMEQSLQKAQEELKAARLSEKEASASREKLARELHNFQEDSKQAKLDEETRLLQAVEKRTIDLMRESEASKNEALSAAARSEAVQQAAEIRVQNAEKLLRDREAAVERMSNELSEVRAKLVEGEASLKIVRSELQRVELELSEAKSGAGVDELASRVTELSGINSRLQAELLEKENQLSASERACDNLRNDIEDLKKAYKDLSEEKERSEEGIAEMENRYKGLIRDAKREAAAWQAESDAYKDEELRREASKSGSTVSSVVEASGLGSKELTSILRADEGKTAALTDLSKKVRTVLAGIDSEFETASQDIRKFLSGGKEPAKVSKGKASEPSAEAAAAASLIPANGAAVFEFA